jgi:hypothetical protein
MTGRVRLSVLLVAVCALVAGASTLRQTWSGWTATTSNPGISFAAAPDWEPPALGTAVIGKEAGGTAGYIHQGGTYYVYANVSDGGNPASGTSAVTVSLPSLTTGQTAVALTTGSFTAQGSSYNRRSALLTATSVLSAGAYTTTVTTTDAAANSATVAGPAATVDNTLPVGADVQIDNGAGTAGHPDSGDVLTYTWSEQLDSYAVLSGWTGAATNVRVVVARNGTTSDSVTAYSSDGVTQLPMGGVDLGKLYTTSASTFAATMTQAGATITVTLGTLLSGVPKTTPVKTAMVWSTGLVPGATDRAGNALTATTVTESGTSDYEF